MRGQVIGQRTWPAMTYSVKADEEGEDGDGDAGHGERWWAGSGAGKARRYTSRLA